MKKRLCMLLGLAMLVLLFMPMVAGAEKVVMDAAYLYCSPGQNRAAIYPDFSSKIGSGLTKDDFIITYESTSEYLTVDENGYGYVSEDAPLMYNLRLRITYTPKVAGVGETTTFVVILRTIEPMTQFEADKDIIYTNVKGGRYELEILGVSDHEDQIADISYDPEIVSLDTYTYFDKILYYYIQAAGKAGETDVVFTAYNGMTTSTKVIVVELPSKLAFASDRFVCHVGETVDLGTDTGNGEYGLMGYKPTVYLYKDEAEASAAGYFPDGAGSFYAKETGIYRIRMTANSFSDEATVEVYDKANCKTIELSSGDLYKDRSGIMVNCYDENGNSVFLPMSITAGADIAQLKPGHGIYATGLGAVTITVQNDDGTTTEKTFEVKENPTKVSLNAAELTLPIEEDFKLQVTFDQGSYPYTYTIDYEEDDPPYGLYCIRMEGDRVIAQAPGAATITVKAGPLSASCKITVPESDKVLSIVTPPAPFGIGHTFKLVVQDKTGKVYPAVFSTSDRDPSGQGVLVEPDGTITGNAARTGNVIAKLPDGRVLTVGIDVKRVPKWLEYHNIAVSLSEGIVYLTWCDSDVGDIHVNELEITSADPSIVSHPGGNLARLDLHKAGVTEVTFKSIYSDASVTIIVEVIDKEALYAGSTSLEVPYGYMSYLPAVTDGQGNEVEITWAITYDLPGEGNTESSGFVLEGDAIACVWPTARCVVTGTSKEGAQIKVLVSGYLLPTEISTKPTGVKIAVGASTQIRVVSDQEGTSVKRVYWIAETEGIVRFSDAVEDDTNTFTGAAPGSTRVLAMLDNGAYAVCDILVYEPGSYIAGDANGDGVVDRKDALLVMQYDAGWDVSINVSAGDVNADGRADAEDALMILEYEAGLDVILRKKDPAS